MASVNISSDLEPKKIKSDTVYIISPSICHDVMGVDAMILVFWMLSFSLYLLIPYSPFVPPFIPFVIIALFSMSVSIFYIDSFILFLDST